MLLLDMPYVLGILDCTQTVFIAAGFRGECGKIYKMSLEYRGIYEMEKEKSVCVRACVCVRTYFCV